MARIILAVLTSLALLPNAAPPAAASAAPDTLIGAYATYSQTSDDGCVVSSVVLSAHTTTFTGKHAPDTGDGALRVDLRDHCRLTVPVDCDEECEPGPTTLAGVSAELTQAPVVTRNLTAATFSYASTAIDPAGEEQPVSVSITWSATGSATRTKSTTRQPGWMLVESRYEQPAIAEVRVVVGDRTIVGPTDSASIWRNRFTWIAAGR